MKCLGLLSVMVVFLGCGSAWPSLAEEGLVASPTQMGVREKPLQQDDIAAFYQELKEDAFWFDSLGRPQLLRQQQLEAWVVLSHEHGLDPHDYGLPDLVQPAAALPAAERERWLTRQFLSLAADLQGAAQVGQTDPDWHFADRIIGPDKLAARLVAGESVRQLLDSLLPAAAEYQRLVQLYRRLWIQAQQAWTVPELPEGRVSPGDSYPQIPALRRWLREQHWLESEPPEGAESLLYDTDMMAAVQRFQRHRGLDADGIIGPDTRRALQRNPRDLLRQVRANLARWRALPRELGEHYLLVRTGTFNLSLIERDQSLQQYAVIAGRPDRPSPSFEARIDRLVVNPNWTVPFRLAVEDLLPKQQADEQYFQRQGIDVLQRQENGQWQPVAMTEIDWSGLSRRNFHYLLQQRPGPLNSLGRIRVGMSNPYSIYLHDTPQKSLYGRAQRAFSSGCIRVKDIDELARILAGGEKVNAALEQSETRQLMLATALPVYLVYFTVWIDATGTAFLHPDSYGLDSALDEGLGPLPEPPSDRLFELARAVVKQ